MKYPIFWKLSMDLNWPLIKLVSYIYMTCTHHTSLMLSFCARINFNHTPSLLIPNSNDTWSVLSKNMQERFHCLLMHLWWKWLATSWRPAISSSRRVYWAIWLFHLNTNVFWKTLRRASASLKTGSYVIKTLVRNLELTYLMSLLEPCWVIVINVLLSCIWK